MLLSLFMVLSNDSYAALKKVSRFKATASTKSSISLYWDEVAGATGYQVQKKVGKKYKTIATKYDVTRTTATKLSIGTKYNFRIRCFVIKNKIVIFVV